MQFNEISDLKRALALLKQISRDIVYIYGEKDTNGLHLATINKERTILLDMFLKKENSIDKEENNEIKDFSVKTGKIFYDIMDSVEKGSIVDFQFLNNDAQIKISYDDIKLKSSLNSIPEKFIGFPPLDEKTVFKVSGEKMTHALNLLCRFRNDLEVKIENNNLILESTNEQGSNKLVIPSNLSKKEKKKKIKSSIYDYEIIKPLVSASKLSKMIEINFYWNKKIKNNVIIAKCSFNDDRGHAQYLFTPKGVFDEMS